MTEKNKGAFFDRDGTLILDKHYLCDPNEVEYFDDTMETLRVLQSQGYKLFLVTNQSGIGRGYFQVEQMHKVHQKMIEDFKAYNIEITDIAFCPHSPDDGCDCRKPAPKMLNDLVQKYNIDPKKSFMIGDKVIDAQCGEAAEMTGLTIFLESASKYRNLKTLKELLST